MRAPAPTATEVAKDIQAPIFHVNGDDPEAVVHVSRIATEFRHRFKKDVVIDIFCYRRHGHNEGDEPAFTQPLMYRAIAAHPTTREIYAKRLIAEGVITEAEVEQIGAGIHRQARSRIRGGEELSPEQGRLARRRVDRASGRLGRRSPRRDRGRRSSF